MQEKLICIDYFTEEDRDKKFSKPEDYPFYQLSVGDSGEGSYVFSNPRDFKGVALGILEYLKNPKALDNKYQLKPIGDKTERQLGEQGKQILEEILNLHNDLVTPSRQSLC